MIAVIIAQGVIFVVLIFVLRTFMKSHVSGAVGHLQTMNDELMKQQGTLKAKIAESEKEYQAKIKQLNQEIEEKQNSVREQANKTLEDARETALKEREKLINEAVETKERLRMEIMADIESIAIQHSKGMITDFFSEDLKKIIHEHLIEQVAEGIAGLNMEAFQIQAEEIELVSAYKLTEKQKSSLQKVLDTKIDKKLAFKEKEDKKVVCGLILKFGTLVVDGSLSNKLDEAAAEMKKKTAKDYQKST